MNRLRIVALGLALTAVALSGCKKDAPPPPAQPAAHARRLGAATAPTTADPHAAVSETAGDEMLQEIRWGRVPARRLNLCAKPGAISF